MPDPIPPGWRQEVVRILRTDDRRLIEWTGPAFERWDADTYGVANKADAHDAMIEALEREDITGNETTSYAGQLATYEFFFSFRSRLMYGKIALYENRLRILILSAHKANKTTL